MRVVGVQKMLEIRIMNAMVSFSEKLFLQVLIISELLIIGVVAIIVVIQFVLSWIYHYRLQSI